jgi:lipopolysaccharide export system protein LptC
MRLLLLTILLGLLITTWWVLQPRRPEPGTTVDHRPDRIDYFITGLDLTTYGADGLPRRRLQARQVEHFERSGQTRLTAPRLQLLVDGKPLWDGQARQGLLSGDRRRLTLESNVTIDRHRTEKQPPMRLLTSRLLVHPQESYAETDAPVFLTSEKNWIRAVGMQAWLQQPSRIRFLSDTRAYYVVE